VLDIKIEWNGKGLEEVGIDSQTGKTIVAVDAKYYRPAEVESLLGDSSKAREELGWVPRISFEELVQEMIVSDLEKEEINKINSKKFSYYDDD